MLFPQAEKTVNKLFHGYISGEEETMAIIWHPT